MRVAFVILCCALQYITSEIIDDKIHNIFNDKNKYETKNETTSDEFETDPNTGKVVEKRTTHKELLLKNGCGSDVDEGDVEIIKILITKDDQGRERISEEDTTIKKVQETTVNGNAGIPVTYTSSSSASAASQTPQRNTSEATRSAASASIVGPNGSQGPYNPLSSSSSSTAPTGSQDREKIIIENIHYHGPGPAGSPDASPTTKGASSSAASAASGGPGSGTTAASAAETHGPASGSNSAASSSSTRSGAGGPENISDTQGSSEGSEEGGRYENAPGRGSVYRSRLGSSGSPRGSTTKTGVKTGTQRPENRPVSNPAGIAPGKRPTELDFDEPGYYGEYDVPPQLSIINYNEGRSVTSSSAASATSGGLGSASSAASAAGTQGPVSGSTSAASSSDAGGPGSSSGTQRSSRRSEEGEACGNGSEPGGVNQPHGNQLPKLTHKHNTNEHGSSGSPRASTTKKGDKTGTPRTENRPVSKPAVIAPGKRPTELDFDEPGYYGEYDVPPQLSIINYNEGRSVISSSAASAASGGPGSGTTAASAAETHGPASGSTSAASSSSTRSDTGGPENISDTQGSSEGSEEGGRYENAPGRGSVYRSRLGSSGSPRGSTTKTGVKTGTQRPENRPVSNPAGIAPGKRPTELDFDEPGYYGEYDVPPQLSIINYNEGSSVISSSAASTASGGPGSASSAASAAGTQGPVSGSTSPASSSDAGGLRSGSGTQRSSGRLEEGKAYRNGSEPGGVYQPHGNQRPKLTHKYKTNEHGSSGSPRASTTKKGDKTGTPRPENRPVSKPAGIAPGKRPTELDFDEPGYYGEYDVPPQLSIINYNEGSSVISSSAASTASGGPGSASSAASAAGTQGPVSGFTSPASSSDAGGLRSGSGTQRSSGRLEEGKAYRNGSEPGGVYQPHGNQRPKLTHKYKTNEHGSSGSPRASTTKKGDKTGTPRPENRPVSKPAGIAPGKRPTELDFDEPGYYGEYDVPPQLSIINYNEGRSVTSSSAASATSGGLGSASSAASAAGTQGPLSGSTSAASSSDAGGPGSSSGTKRSSRRSEEGEACGNGSEPGGVYQPHGNQLPKLNHKHKTNEHGSSGSPRASNTKKGDKTGTPRPENRPVSKPAGIAPGKRPTELDFDEPGYYGEYDVQPQLSIINYNEGRSVISSSAASATSGGQGSASSAASAAGTQGPVSGSTSPASSSDAGGPRKGSGTQESSGESREGEAYGNGSEPGGVYQPYGNQRQKLTHKHKTKEHGSSGSPRASTTKKGDKTGTPRPENRPVSKPAGIAPGKRPTELDFDEPGYYGEYYVPPQLSIINYNEGRSVTSSSAASATSGGLGSASSAASAAGTQGPLSGSTSAASSSDAGGPGSSSGTKRSSRRSEEGEACGNGSEPGGVYQPHGNQLPKLNHKHKTNEHGSSGSPRASNTKKGDKTGTPRPENRPVSKPAGIAPGKRPTELDFDEPGYYGEYDVPPQLSIINYNEGRSVISSSAASATSGGQGSASSAASAAGTQGPVSGSTSPASSSDAGGPRKGSGTQESSGESREGEAYGNGSEPGGVYQPYGNQRQKLTHKHKTKEHGSSGSPRASTTKKGDKTGTPRPENRPVSKPAGIAPGKRPTELDFDEPGYYGEYNVPPQLSIINYNEGRSVISSSAASAASGGPGSGTTAASAADTHGPASGSTSAASSSSTRSDAGGPENISDTQGSSEGSEEGGRYENAPGRGSVYRSRLGSSGSPRGSTTKTGVKTGTQRPENRPVSNPAGIAPGKRPTELDFDEPGYYGEYDVPPQLSIINYNEGSSVISSSAASTASGGPGSASSAASAAGTQGPVSGSTSAASSSDAGGPGSSSGTQRSSRRSEEGEACGNGSEPGGVNQPHGNQLPKLTHKHNTNEHGSSGSPRASTTKKADKTGTPRPENRPVSKPAGIAPGKRPTELDFDEPGYYGEYDVPPQLSIINYNEGRSVISSSAASAASGGPGSGTTAASAAETHGPASGSTSAASSSSTRSDAGGPENISDTQGSSEGSEEGGRYENAPGRGRVYRSRLDSSGSPRGSTTKTGVKTGTQRPENRPVSNPAGIAPGKRPTELDFDEPGYYGEYDVPPQLSIINYNEGSSVTSLSAASATSGGLGSASSAASAAGTQGPLSGSTSAASSSDAGGPGSSSGTQRSSRRSEEGEACGNGSEPGGVYQPHGNQLPKLTHKHKTNEHGSSGSPRASTTKKGDKTGTPRPENRPVSKPAGIAPGKRPTELDFDEPGYYGEYDVPPQLSIINYNEGRSVISSSAASATSGGQGSASSAASAAGTQGPVSGSTSPASSSDAGGPRKGSGTQESSGESREGETYGNGSEPGGVYQPYGNQRQKLTHKHKTKEHGSSGSPRASTTKKGDKTGTPRPENRPVSKPAGIAPGKRPTELDFDEPGYYGEYDVPPQLSIINYNEGRSVTSSSAASATSGGLGSASSAASAAGTQGPVSGSTSAASSSDAGGPGSSSGTQRSSRRSEEGEACGNGSEPGGVYQPHGNQLPKLTHKHKTNEHGSSGSPRASTTKKGDKTGTPRPENRPVSKPAGIAPGKRPTELDFDEPGYYGEYYVPPQLSIINYNGGRSVISSSAASAASGGPGSGTTAASAADTHGPASGSTSAASSSSTRSDAGGPENISDTQGSSKGSEEGGRYENAPGRGSVYRSRLGSSGSPRGSTTKTGVKTGTQRPENRPVSNPAGIAPGKRPTELDFDEPGYYGEYDVPPQLSIINYNEGSSVISSSAASTASGGPGSASSAASAAGTQGPVSGSTSAASSSDAGGPGSSSGTQRSSRRSEEGEACGNGSEPGGVNQPHGNQLPKLTHKHNTNEHGSSGSPRASTTKKADKTGTPRPENRPVSKPAGIAPGKRPTELDFDEPGYYGEYDVPPQLSIINYNEGRSVISSSAASAASGGPGSGTTAASAAETHGPASGSTSAASSSSTRSDAGGPENISDTQGSSEGSEEGGRYENAPGRGSVYRSRLDSSGSPRGSTTKTGVKTGTQRPENRPVSNPAGIAPGKRPTELDFDEPGYYGEYDVPPQLSIINYNEGSSVTSLSAASATSGGLGSASSAASAAGTQGPLSGSTSAASSSDAGGPGSSSGTQRSSRRSEEGEACGNGSEPGGVYQPHGNQLPKLTHKHKTNEHGSSGSPRASTTKKGDKTGTPRPENRPVSKPAGIAPGKRPTELDFDEPGYYGEYDVPPQLSIINYNEGRSVISSSAASATSGGPGSTSPAVTIPESFARTNGSASKLVDSITGNDQNELGPDSYLPGYYGQDYLAPQDLLIIEDNAVGTANNINRLKSGSSGLPSASPITKEGVSGTQRPGSGPASKPIDSITGNNENELEPDFYGPGYYGQDYSAPNELPTIKDNERGSELSLSPAARAPARESAGRIPDAAPTRSGVASGVTSVQGRKRVRQACRLRSSQFVLRLGRKDQPCTFCY